MCGTTHYKTTSTTHEHGQIVERENRKKMTHCSKVFFFQMKNAYAEREWRRKKERKKEKDNTDK